MSNYGSEQAGYVVTDCTVSATHHDWQPSEWRLITVKDKPVFDQPVFVRELYIAEGPRVDVCRRCGALRVRKEDRG